MVERDQGEGEESPEDEGVGEAGERALADDLGLEEDLPDEIADAAADGADGEAEVLAGSKDGAEYGGEAEEEECGGRGGEGQQQDDFERGGVLGLGKYRKQGVLHHAGAARKEMTRELLRRGGLHTGIIPPGSGKWSVVSGQLSCKRRDKYREMIIKLAQAKIKR